MNLSTPVEPAQRRILTSVDGDGTNISDFEEDDDYDDEIGCGGMSRYTSLSSAETSFDRLLQSVAHRDRRAFAAYVRAEVDKDSVTNGHRSNGSKDGIENNTTNSKNRTHFLIAYYLSLSPWWRSLLDRFFLLAGLLFLQSCSSLVLSSYADFIQQHVIVTLYLTMLVGAGGNAGNQAAVLVIRMLATSSRRIQSLNILWREMKVAFVMGILMIVIGFGRVYIFEGGDVWATIAITASLYVIVTVSIVLGSALPLLLHRFRLDPAHAGPVIQVIMDILGVLVTCAICSVILQGVETPGMRSQRAENTHLLTGEG